MFRERGREGESEGEKHRCVVASHAPPAGDPTHSPGLCPDWESNGGPSSSQAGTQSTEPHQPGPNLIFQIDRCVWVPFPTRRDRRQSGAARRGGWELLCNGHKVLVVQDETSEGSAAHVCEHLKTSELCTQKWLPQQMLCFYHNLKRSEIVWTYFPIWRTLQTL